MFKKIQTGLEKKKNNKKTHNTSWIYVFFLDVHLDAVTNQISALVPSREGLLSFYSLIYFSLFSLPSTNTLVPMSQASAPIKERKSLQM